MKNDPVQHMQDAARVIFEGRGAYRVKDASGEYLAKITGRQMFTAASRQDYPVVGDFVRIRKADAERAVILEVLPRQSIIKRRNGNDAQLIAANVDVAFVVESVDRDYNLNRFERYFAIAKDGGVQPAIVLNKTDLLSSEKLADRIRQLRDRFPGIVLVATSTVGNTGLDELKKSIIAGNTYCFLGSSGVGKSSLINKLLGGMSADKLLPTKEISSYSGRGKHVTTSRQMYFLQNGGIVIDNPGMREVGMADVREGIDSFFDEITALGRKCRYVDCTHVREPGCAVLGAVQSGELDESKYSNYVQLKKEAEYYEMSGVEKREKDRKFGKFIKKVKRELHDIGRKDY